MAVKIYWSIPEEIKSSEDYSKVRIYRSLNEQKDYDLLDTIDLVVPGSDVYTTSYEDTTPEASTDKFYYIRFYNPTADIESKIYITFFEITPREARLIEGIKKWMPDVLLKRLDDQDYRAGLKLGILNFNTFPPLTHFTIDDFPYDYENFLIIGSVIFTVLTKYLNISFKDINFSDSGLSLPIDRGSKMMAAVEKMQNMYNTMMKAVKMNFVTPGTGIGTLSLPISMTGRISSNLMDIMNIFTHLM